MTAADRVRKLIEEHEIVVFSKTTCPYCSKAKSVLTAQPDVTTRLKVLELDTLPPADAAAMQDYLGVLTGARTVPRIFANGKSIGGCDDLLRLQKDGMLEEVLSSKPDGQSGFKLVLSEADWKKKLDPKKYNILRKQGTEPPHSHAYNTILPTKGHFACAACALPLYSATSKFKSSCGWPVFSKCYYSKQAGGCHVAVRKDFGGVEIICKRCESHLGHVFFDAFSASNPNGERH